MDECWHNVLTMEWTNIDITFTRLDGQILTFSIYDGMDEYSPLIGKFCGTGYFPQSIVGKFIRNQIFAFCIVLNYFLF